ncbi:MAG TPA: class I SAM-dependent methyltransferase [Candidatus Binatia bacterium]|nr:class I SAM-dependent methyltransferase [Candidatus Binatia bacterium]
MTEQKGFHDILTSPAENRQQVTASFYDRIFESKLISDLPSKRRQKRIAIYREVIGRGHKAILEIGCGRGDLTYALVNHAEKVVGIDISVKGIELARKRKDLWSLTEEQSRKIEFLPMPAVQLDFADATFDWAISTSLVEHLHPDDIIRHMLEVRRTLRPGGKYLIWCPNRLGHHQDREHHLSMLCYSEWIEKLREAGFSGFRSTLTWRLPMIDAGYKVFLEQFLTTLRFKLLWTHLGVRNVFLVAVR